MIIHDNLRYRMPDWANTNSSLKMHDRHLKVAMGFRPEDKWPARGVSERMVGNVRVWVNAIPLDRSRQTHRAMAACPRCAAILTAGRLHQHQKSRECRAAGGI